MMFFICDDGGQKLRIIINVTIFLTQPAELKKKRKSFLKEEEKKSLNKCVKIKGEQKKAEKKKQLNTNPLNRQVIAAF